MVGFSSLVLVLCYRSYYVCLPYFLYYFPLLQPRSFLSLSYSIHLYLPFFAPPKQLYDILLHLALTLSSLRYSVVRISFAWLKHWDAFQYCANIEPMHWCIYNLDEQQHIANHPRLHNFFELSICVGTDARNHWNYLNYSTLSFTCEYKWALLGFWLLLLLRLCFIVMHTHSALYNALVFLSTLWILFHDSCIQVYFL